MRRYLVLSVVSACLLLLAPGSAALGSSSTAASSGASTYYAGANSQGQRLLFTVDNTPNGPMFDPIFINQISRCPVTGDVIQMEFLFQGFLVPIKNGKFSINLFELTDLFRWNGTVTTKAATGRESIDLAAFDTGGGLQDCGAGSLAWKAQALVPAAAVGAPKASYVIKVTKAANGSVHYSITH